MSASTTSDLDTLARYVIGGDVAAARNPSTAPETLARLARTGSHWTRFSVAHNPNTPPEALAHLADDPAPSVRSLALANPHCPGHVRLAAALSA